MRVLSSLVLWCWWCTIENTSNFRAGMAFVLFQLDSHRNEATKNERVSWDEMRDEMRWRWWSWWLRCWGIWNWIKLCNTISHAKRLHLHRRFAHTFECQPYCATKSPQSGVNTHWAGLAQTRKRANSRGDAARAQRVAGAFALTESQSRKLKSLPIQFKSLPLQRVLMKTCARKRAFRIAGASFNCVRVCVFSSGWLVGLFVYICMLYKAPYVAPM